MGIGSMPWRSTLTEDHTMRIKTKITSLAAVAALAALALPAGANASAGPLIPTPGMATPERHGPYLPLAAQPEIGDGLGAGRGHEGADLFAATGTDLLAVTDAIVLETGTDGGRGNYISIYSPSRDETYNYLHMTEPALVGAGVKVDAGQVLGYLGCTGSCYGAHLHFEVRAGRSTYGAVLDPLPLLGDLRLAPADAATRAGESPSEAASPALP